MYEHNSRQIAFHNEPFLFGGLPLNSDNRWVKLAGLIPWFRVEEAYHKNFRGNQGTRAMSVRLALGCLIVKEQLQLSDVDTVQMIRENPYIQYFLGYADYQYDLSLDASLLTHFRRRFSIGCNRSIESMGCRFSEDSIGGRREGRPRKIESSSLASSTLQDT